MAEKLCTLRTKGGGGGRYNETSLWTNSAPTSNFAAQAVSLSDSIDNYKYLRVRYRMSTTDASEYSCIFLVDDIKHSSASTNVPQFSVVARTTTTYVRTFYYVSGTSLQMNAAYVMNNTGNVTNVAIPLEILGLNELDHGAPTLSYITSAAVAKTSLSQTETYTFTSDYKVIYAHGMYSSAYDISYSGTGERTTISKANNQIIVKIDNVKSGDTITFPCTQFTVSGNNAIRCIYSIIGA